MAYRRDPLAATRRGLFLDRMRHQRESLTDREVEDAMVKIASARLADGEDVGPEHFKLANLPMEKVYDLYERVKTRVKYEGRAS